MMSASMHRFCRVAVTLAVVLIFVTVGVVSAEETVCLQCHGSQEGHLGQPVQEWRDSIHAANGNSCHGCHGGDPADFAMAMSPERGFLGVPDETEIPAFCGRCHVGVLEDYSGSAHGQALGQGGPQCVTCHQAHNVKQATPELINEKDCSRCHDYGRAEKIKAAMLETDEMISTLRTDLAALRRLGIATETMEGDVFSWSNRFHRLFHSVDVKAVREQTDEVQQGLGKVRAQIAAIEDQLLQRKLAGGAVVGLLLLGGIVCFLIRQTYRE